MEKFTYICNHKPDVSGRHIGESVTLLSSRGNLVLHVCFAKNIHYQGVMSLSLFRTREKRTTQKNGKSVKSFRFWNNEKVK